MTRFFVDHKEIEIPMGSSSVRQFLQRIDDGHLNRNAAVREIHINGCPLVWNTAGGRGQRDQSGCAGNPATIEAFTGDIAEIARGSIVEGLSYLERIESVTPSLVKAFRGNAEPDAFEDLRQLYEGFYWLNLLLDRLERDFKIGSENAFTRLAPEPGYRAKFISTLRLLTESQEKGDVVRIADLLERHILPLVPCWREALHAAMQKAGGGP